MIDRIEGELIEREPTHAVMDVGGIGFHISISLQTYEALPGEGRAKLYTHLHVREDIL
ncbi:MAG TPA: Holliday junction branch migration protein RuvA, partial [Bacteroidetes bacterium]|nr:Holliday junction branch migration protein RuvA [Bacteroidota bacterium]